MPECELPCEWLVVWSDTDVTISREGEVYYTDQLPITTQIFNMMLTNADLVTYTIEEDGEVMEFTYQLDTGEPQVFVLYRKNR